ncbi:hypothetical protein Taro_024438, partial [Colocasia esculenta]|nr:hypothetical protein [Colocasia esculenta]
VFSWGGEKGSGKTRDFCNTEDFFATDAVVTCELRRPLPGVKSASASQKIPSKLTYHFPPLLSCSCAAGLFVCRVLGAPSPPLVAAVVVCALRRPIMEAKIGKFFESVGNFFIGGDSIPWCDRDIIAICCWRPVLLVLPSWEASPEPGSTLDRDLALVWALADQLAIGCEREVEEANGSAEKKNESIMRLSWALVHSKQPEDVQRGIAMLEAFSSYGKVQFVNDVAYIHLFIGLGEPSLANASSPLQKREKLYLLAVGFYRSGEFVRSRQLLEQCLEV